MGEEVAVSPRQQVMLAKHKIKAWEGEYKAAHGGPPDREAMSQAPEHVRHAYKTYRYYRQLVAQQNSKTRSSAGEEEEEEEEEGLSHRSKQCVSSSLVSVWCADGPLACPADAIEASPASGRKEAVGEEGAGEASCSSVTEVAASCPEPAVKCTSASSGGVWGKHLNKNSHNLTTAKKAQSETSMYNRMAENLRARSTIKMRKSLSKTTSSTKNRLRNICDKGDVSRDGDSGCSKAKANEGEGTLLQVDNTSTTSEKSEASHTSLSNNTGDDELRSTSRLFDASESTHNTTFHDVYNNNNRSEELRPLSTLEAMEAKFSRNSPICNTTNKPKPTQLTCPETTPKYHEVTGKENVRATRAISALSSLGQDFTSGPKSIKRMASLNLGWVARCTGTSLDDTTQGTDSLAQENWKMRLIDKDWKDVGEEDKEETRQQQRDCNDYHVPPPLPTSSYSKPTRITTKTTTTAARRKNAAGNDVAPEGTTPKRSKGGRTTRTRSTRNATTTPACADLNNGEASIVGGASSLREISQAGKLLPEVDQLREGLSEEEEKNHERTSDLTNLQSSSVSQRGACVGKRKKESLEELEEKGKIVSQWPPPKKKRVARKKAANGNCVRKVGKEISTKVQRKGRKRKKAESEEEEEEEEVDTPDTPHTPSQQSSLPNLDYDETQDIDSHGSKTTRAMGRCLTGEERMTRKITSGGLNDNYVRINIKKKVFVRGKKTMTAGKYKRQEWKKKQLMKSAEGGSAGAVKNLTCFKCGDFGHWARNCPGKRGDALTPLEAYDENESDFLSLEEAAAMALGVKKVDDKPTTKMYHRAQESEAGGDDGTANASNDDVVRQLPLSELQETLPADVEEQEREMKEEEAVQGDVDLRDTHGREDDATQRMDGEVEYDFGDSDDDIFGNLDEKDLTEQQHEASDTNTGITQLPASPSHNASPQKPSVKPLYNPSGGEAVATTEEVYEALRKFGHESFRPGQEEAIMRILSGQSTLLVLSTGSGKSLCYQLPAYLFSKHRSPCITLCISPLVSLMEDQVTGLPKFLRAVCLHTHQTPSQRSSAMAALQSRAAHILLVSPEAVVASRSGGVLGTLLKELPPVAFACLDEAHCVSEWSHNFRPSYLRVCRVLHERLGVRTILGLTATARTATATSIARHLVISDLDAGVIRGTSVPENLRLSASRDRNREEALVTLLQGERFSGCSSIIVYCTRRDECERVATLIRAQLHRPSRVDVKSNTKKTRGLSFDAEAYHAGLSSHRRQQVQKRFMSGKLRIVVATVAFGMGIDKSDVRGIVHYNMPRNVESYVQEIGRAGRDGEEAHCHLFLDDQDGRDIQELKRHIFANSLDRHTIRKLLSKIFKPCTCAKLKGLSLDGREREQDTSLGSPSSPVCLPSAPQDGGAVPASTCPKHEVAIPIDTVVEELDLPEENLETLLCYLELHQGNLIHINSHVYANCTVSCYGGPRQLVAVSRRCPPLAVAVALERQKGTDLSKSSRVTFPVVEIASRMGWNSKIVKRELKSLEWNTQDLPNGGKVRRSGVVVEMTDLSFRLEARGDLSDDERDRVLDAVYRRARLQEQDQLRQLHYTYQLLRSTSHSTILFCCDSVDEERCNRLRTELREYFRSVEALPEAHTEDKVNLTPAEESGIRNSVQAFLSTYQDQQWTGRAVARVFHGIGSPNYPTQTWGRVRRYWRQHLNTDFNVLVSIATQEILRCKLPGNQTKCSSF